MHTLKMSFGFIIGLTGIAVAMTSRIAWLAPVPGIQPMGRNLPNFTAAIESKGGGFVVAGAQDSTHYLVRLDSLGRIVWESSAQSSKFSESPPEGLWETPGGVVDLWRNAMGPPGSEIQMHLEATTRDGQGLPTATLTSGPGFAMNWDRIPSGDFLFTKWVRTIENASDIVVERRGFSPDSDWTLDLGTLSSCSIHALSGGQSLVIGRRNNVWVNGRNTGDTLELYRLDSRGRQVWATEILPENHPELHSIPETDWYALGVDPSGAILISGTTYVDVNGDFVGAGVAVMALSSDGKLLGMKSQPIKPLGIQETSDGKPLVQGVEATDHGFRIKIVGDQSMAYLGVSAKGEFTNDFSRTPTEYEDSHYAGTHPHCVAVGAAGFVAVGNMQDLWLPFTGNPLGYFPGGFQYPVLLVPSLQKVLPQEKWKAIPLLELGDTTLVYLTGNLGGEGPAFYTKPGPSLSFLLPTSDGGALIGGSLWTRNGKDTVMLAAVKLAPGYEVGLARTQKVKNGNSPGHNPNEFDILGRIRKDIRSRVFAPTQLLWRPN